MRTQPLPEPCSILEQDLKSVEVALAKFYGNKETEAQRLAAILYGLVFNLRLHERERVAKIYSQI